MLYVVVLAVLDSPSTFKGSSGAGLTANTTYYLLIEQQGTTVSDAKTTTYDNMTVAPEG